VGGTPLSAFADMRKNGCWYLNIADHADQDTGTVCEWTVHLYNHAAVGVEEQAWGQVKVLYRD
jgi:subtilisin-like proprotein convertase family protein